jgi:hypothetical protein
MPLPPCADHAPRRWPATREDGMETAALIYNALHQLTPVWSGWLARINPPPLHNLDILIFDTAGD